MSILIVQVHAEGIIFAADCHVTTVAQDGTTAQDYVWRKVMKWPRDEILLGYVGALEIGGQPAHAWFESLRDEFRGIASLEEISRFLAEKVQNQRSKDEGSGPPNPLIIHLGGFVSREDLAVPEVWFVRNVYGLGHFGYRDCRKEFEQKEAFWGYFPDTQPSEIRDVLHVRAKQFDPFWFHQGTDLLTFNVLQSALDSSFKALCQCHPRHEIPRTLEEWSKHARMKILMYGAYHEAFFPSDKQYVGGGSDVEFLPWPSETKGPK